MQGNIDAEHEYTGHITATFQGNPDAGTSGLYAGCTATLAIASPRALP